MVETIIYNNVYVWSIFMFLTSVIYIKSLVYKIFDSKDLQWEIQAVPIDASMFGTQTPIRRQQTRRSRSMVAR